MNLLTELLRIELPILQAPMAGVQGSALAIAVSGAGGLGALPGAMSSADNLRAEIVRIRAASSRPYNVNFFCHVPPVPDPAREARWRARLTRYYRELGIDESPAGGGPSRAPFSAEVAELLRELAPPVVSFHFGLPAPDLLQKVRGWGAKILSTATTVEEGVWLEEHGVDAVIAQGWEAGGHRGSFLPGPLPAQLGTFALVRQLARRLRVPVIAAGGIADPAGVAAARALGAAGVQVGTAYLLCPEATTSLVHRAALKSDAVKQTAITNVFSGRPARGILNRVMRELGPWCEDAPEFPLASAALAPLRSRAEERGSGDFSPLWSGQNGVFCREIPAAQLTRELAVGWG
jgi:nitronate monooxygenase